MSFKPCNGYNPEAVDGVCMRFGVHVRLFYRQGCGHIDSVSSFCERHVNYLVGSAEVATECSSWMCKVVEPLTIIDLRDVESVERWLSAPNAGWPEVPF